MNLQQLHIKKIVHNRKITSVTHFTRVENLKSILRYGIMSRDKIQFLYPEYLYNDPSRLDKNMSHTSCSISFPNADLFYKWRQRYRDSNWAVLILHPKILWEKDCLFYPTNAASGVFSAYDLNDLKGAQALENMFTYHADLREHYLEDCDPTDLQAEVMIPGRIDLEMYLRGCILMDKDLAAKYQQAYKEFKFFYRREKSKIFTTRKAFRFGH